MLEAPEVGETTSRADPGCTWTRGEPALHRHRSARPTLAFLLLTVALGLEPGIPAAAAEPGLAEELDRLFTAAYPAGEPGAAVLVKQGAEVVLREGYGMADLELGVPIEPDMVFRLASITKQLTGAAFLRLVEEGELSLDATVGEVLPGYEGPAGRITIHQLLTHTGGVPGPRERPGTASRCEDATPAELIDGFRDEPLDFEPGTAWRYSNRGYFLLGAVVEELSGESYEDFVEGRILAPLGMVRSRYARPSEIVPRRVAGYQPAAGGYVNADYISMSRPYAAGGLLSTVDDLARWDEALRGDELLPPELRELLWTPARLADGRTTGYGYGFVVHDYQGHRMMEHSGGIKGFNTALVRVPDREVFVAVLSNKPGARPGTERLALEAATRVLGKPLADRPSVALAAEALDEYVGVYEQATPVAGPGGGGGEDRRVVSRDGSRLFTQRTGGPRFPVLFSEKDRFFYPDDLTTGRFVRDAGGRVTGMRLQPHVGPEEYAPRSGGPVDPEQQETDTDSGIVR